MERRSACAKIGFKAWERPFRKKDRCRDKALGACKIYRFGRKISIAASGTSKNAAKTVAVMALLRC